MQGLLLKLSALDAAAENAVRLISLFDSLVEQQVNLDTLLRSAAMVAECPVGLQDHTGQFAVRATPDGTVDAGRADPTAAVRPLGPNHLAWIGRSPEQALPLDELLLERLAIASISTVDHARPAEPAFGDPALLEFVISRSTGAPERSRALHLLGLAPSTALTLVAVCGPDDLLDAATAGFSGDARPRRARLGTAYAVAVTGQLSRDVRVPPGVTVGVGTAVPATDAPASWDKAVRAVRFAEPAHGPTDPADRAVVFAADLGPYELLAARLRSSDIRDVADLDALDALAGEANGADVVHTVEVVVEAGSLREAARQLHLHHNSVAARVARAEQRLGYRITEPRGIARVGLALALRRLRSRDLIA